MSKPARKSVPSSPPASAPPLEPSAETPSRATPAAGADFEAEAEGPAGPTALAVRAPLETIAHAMKAQVDLLRQLQERQRTLEDAVRDEKRHELVVNSAESLNAAFRGLQDSQERLAEKLADGGGVGRGLRVWIAVGALALLAAGGATAWFLRRGAEGLDAVKDRLSAPAADESARAALAELAARVRGVEASERAAFADELDRLRKAVDGAAAERETLRRERDQAREELGLVRGKATDAEKSSAELRARLDAADKEIARLTTQTVGDQRLIASLNTTVETLRQRAAARIESPGPTAPPPAPAESAVAVASPPPPAPVADEGAASRAATTPEAPADDPRELPFTPGQRDDLNGLLAKHRGSPRYSVASATKIFDRKLRQVVLEVRGADGSLDKTIEAEAMTVKISPRGEMVDLDFEKGHVIFHGSVGGRDAKSPFFNDRYQIVLLGAPSKDWLSAGLAFVGMR